VTSSGARGTAATARFAAFAVKGLEDVAAAEIRDLLGPTAVVEETRTKAVVFRAGYAEAMRDLRTVDDLCILAADVPTAGSPGEFRDALAAHADLAAAIDLVATLRPMDGTFSVTVSAARAAAGNAKELLATATEVIAGRYGLRPSPPDTRAPIDVRIFVDRSYLLVGVRLFEAPLTHRAYRVVDSMGSLRPTVAAAMVRLARPAGTPARFWDPFCGSGTIPAEAALAGHEIAGTDISADAVAAARANLATVAPGLEAGIGIGDALSPGTWHRHSDADTIVTNLPWGKQIPIASRATLFTAVGQGIGARVARGGRARILTVEPDRLIAAIRRVNPAAVTHSRTIGLLGQAPTIVGVTPGAPAPR